MKGRESKAANLNVLAALQILLHKLKVCFFSLFLKMTAVDKMQVSLRSSDSKLTQARDFLDCRRVLPEWGLHKEV